MNRLFTGTVLMLAFTAAISAQTQTTDSSVKLADKKIVHRDLAAREESAGKAPLKSPRDAATGQASGKRVASGDGAAEITTPRDSATGQASGKQANETKAPRDVATGQASGKQQPKMSGATSNPLYKDAGKEGTNPLYENKK